MFDTFTNKLLHTNERAHTRTDAHKQELSAYKVAAKDVLPEQDCAEWWKLRQGLPTWKKAAKIVMAIDPSWAAAKRVFLLLKAAFTAQQERALEDQLEVAVMLQFNRGRVWVNSNIDRALQGLNS